MTTDETKKGKSLDEQVPPVTADVDETPKTIKYGAAIILGLAFGVGCYVWYDGGGDYTANDGRYSRAATEQYFNTTAAYDDPTIQGAIPDPFYSPFEPLLDPEYIDADIYLEPTSPAE